MRVSSAQRPLASRTPHAAGAAAGGFRLPVFPGLAQATSVRSALALRPQAGPAMRRREAMRAGAGLLDALDALRLDLLGGAGGALRALAGRLASADLSSGDPDLDDLLDLIRLRAEVEIAKQEMREQEMRERVRGA